MVSVRRARRADDVRPVGQLRYAVVDALAPLAAALGTMHLLGVSTNNVQVCAVIGGAVALLRLAVYVGK